MESLFIGWVGVLPFVMLYGAYEGPKVFWFWIGGFFLTLHWLTATFRSKKALISTQGKWLLLWVGVLSVASVFGMHPVDSFIGGSYRHQGVLFFFTLFLVGETFRNISLRYKNLLVLIFGIGVIVESILVLVQKMSVSSIRPLGTLGEPNAIAGYLAIGLYWILTGGTFPRWVRAATAVIVVAAIAATQSRTGILVVGIVAVGVGFQSVIRNRFTVVFVTCVLGVLLVGSISGYTYIRIINITRAQSHFENRREFWRTGLEEFVKRPFLGFGAESEEIVYDRAYAAKSFPLADFMIDRSHNLFLDVALWSGSVGLVVFMGWLWVTARACIVQYRIDRFFVLFAWIVFASIQPLGVVHWVEYMLLQSIISMGAKKE